MIDDELCLWIESNQGENLGAMRRAFPQAGQDLDCALQRLRRAGRITFTKGGWYAGVVQTAICPHCEGSGMIVVKARRSA